MNQSGSNQQLNQGKPGWNKFNQTRQGGKPQYGNMPQQPGGGLQPQP